MEAFFADEAPWKSAERAKLIARGSSVTLLGRSLFLSEGFGVHGGKIYENGGVSFLTRDGRGRKIGLDLCASVKKQSFRARVLRYARDMHLINNEISVFIRVDDPVLAAWRRDKYRNIDTLLLMCFTGIFGCTRPPRKPANLISDVRPVAIVAIRKGFH